ncbi:MAG: RraA family protein [Streptomyces sp.]|nr:RraA family protein [Streptomyces sp.]
MTIESGAEKSWPLVGTSSVVDVLERHGIDGVILAGARGDGSFVGAALTVDIMTAGQEQDPQDDPVAPSTLWRTLDTAAPGSVLVICTHAQPLTVVGGVSAATALGRGLAGIVTDGLIRDTDEIRGYGLPIRYTSSDPRVMRDLVRVRSCGRPVRFGDVEVAPGDIVVGDGDGVVCVPRHLADEVFKDAVTIEGQEHLWATTSRVLGSISAGYEMVKKTHGVPH